MRFELEFDCNNAAFADFPREEVVRILRDLADRVDGSGETYFSIRDINGNRVGAAQLVGA